MQEVSFKTRSTYQIFSIAAVLAFAGLLMKFVIRFMNGNPIVNGNEANDILILFALLFVSLVLIRSSEVRRSVVLG